MNPKLPLFRNAPFACKWHFPGFPYLIGTATASDNAGIEETDNPVAGEKITLKQAALRYARNDKYYDWAKGTPL